MSRTHCCIGHWTWVLGMERASFLVREIQQKGELLGRAPHREVSWGVPSLHSTTDSGVQFFCVLMFEAWEIASRCELDTPWAVASLLGTVYSSLAQGSPSGVAWQPPTLSGEQARKRVPLFPKPVGYPCADSETLSSLPCRLSPSHSRVVFRLH